MLTSTSVFCKVSQYLHTATATVIFFHDVNCDNNIFRTLAAINKWKLGLFFLSKYLIPSINIALSDIKCRIWKHFVDMAHCSGKNTVLLEFVNVHFQCIPFYFFMF